jgi:hypothetical protein
LQRDLFRRLSTGKPVGPWVDRFAYPFRWTYSVLNAADYFRQAALLDDVKPDPRMAAAIEMIRTARQPDGSLTAGWSPAWASVVRDRCTCGRTIEVVDSDCDESGGLVGFRK